MKLKVHTYSRVPNKNVTLLFPALIEAKSQTKSATFLFGTLE